MSPKQLCAWMCLAAALLVSAARAGRASDKQTTAAAASRPEVLLTARPGDPTKKQIFFISSALLTKVNWSNPATADLSNLPLTTEQAENLRSFLRERMEWSGTNPPTCETGRIEDGFGLFGPPPASRTLAELMTDSNFAQFALIGRVRERVPGWILNHNHPAELIVVSIDEVLRDSTQQLRGLHELSFLQHHGDVSFGGLRVCDLAYPHGDSRLQEGAQLLIGGFMDRENPGSGNINPSLFAPVKDGQVSSAHDALRNTLPVPLSRLRNEIRAQPPPTSQ